MHKLRVGVYISNDFKPEHGGGYSYYTQIIESIDNSNFDEKLEFIFFSIDTNIDKIFKKKHIKINTVDQSARQQILNILNKRYFKIFLKLLLLFRVLHRPKKNEYKLKVQTILKKSRIDVIYYPIPVNLDLDYPFVYTHWDNGHKIMYPFPEVSMHGIFETRKNSIEQTLFQAFAVFCESEAGKKEAIHLYGLYAEKIYVVPLPPGRVVDLKVLVEKQNEILSDYRLASNKFFFYPAQFWAHKNHYNLIISFKEFILSHADFKLVLTGSDQGNLKYIKRVVSDLNLSENVVFTGFVEDSVIFTFYKNALSLVMPTFLGPTNMPLLEAQNLGCKIICSNLPGHREMLKENATYVDPRNAKSILEAMNFQFENINKPEPCENSFFNITNSLRYLEKNFIELIPAIKTFGLESF